MHSIPTHSKWTYVATGVCSIAFCFFVAIFAQATFGIVFDAINSVLSHSSSQATTPIEQGPVATPVLILLAVVGLAIVVAGVVIARNVRRSNRAIEKCADNGTVILDPDYDFAITRYLLGKVTVDLSRTDFSNFDATDFPFEKIHGLVQVRIRETNIPDDIVQKLKCCKSVSKIDIASSSLSSDSASELAELEGVEFFVEGVTQLGDSEQ